jgi:hypothetical protein
MRVFRVFTCIRLCTIQKETTIKEINIAYFKQHARSKCWQRIFKNNEHTNKNIGVISFSKQRVCEKKIVTKDIRLKNFIRISCSYFWLQTQEYFTVLLTLNVPTAVYFIQMVAQCNYLQKVSVEWQFRAKQIVQLNKTHAVRLCRGCEHSKVFNNSPQHSEHRVGNLPVSNWGVDLL